MNKNGKPLSSLVNWARPLIRYDLPVLAYALLIFWLSSQAYLSERRPWVSTFPDWFYHGVEYAILALLLLRATWSSGRLHNLILASVCSWLICVVYAASDEWHQSFVPGREADPSDLLADTIGAAAALFLISLYLLKRKKLTHSERV